MSAAGQLHACAVQPSPAQPAMVPTTVAELLAKVEMLQHYTMQNIYDCSASLGRWQLVVDDIFDGDSATAKIFYLKVRTPVSIAQHFAARQKKTVRMIVVLFSAYAFSEGLDYKSLFSVNSDKNNRGRGEFMVKSEKRETFAHGAGGDCLGKLALLSTLLRQRGRGRGG